MPGPHRSAPGPPIVARRSRVWRKEPAAGATRPGARCRARSGPLPFRPTAQSRPTARSGPTARSRPAPRSAGGTGTGSRRRPAGRPGPDPADVPDADLEPLPPADPLPPPVPLPLAEPPDPEPPAPKPPRTAGRPLVGRPQRGRRVVQRRLQLLQVCLVLGDLGLVAGVDHPADRDLARRQRIRRRIPRDFPSLVVNRRLAGRRPAGWPPRWRSRAR